MYDQQDIQTNKLIALLSNIPILFWLPFITCKDSKFAKFHANQGLILLIIGVVAGIIVGILGIIPLIGILFKIIGWLVEVVTFALMVIGMVNAYQGKAWKFPVIGEFVLIK